MSRFFFHPEPQPGKVILLPPEEAHHLKVQRVSSEEGVLISNGRGRLYRGIVQERDKKGVFVFIVEKVEEEKPPFPLFIWQGILKSPARMDWLVEKLTEIGVTEIGFFPTKRSVKAKVSEEKIQRLRRIAISACKQSGRLWFPGVQVFASWEEFLSDLSRLPGKMVFLADPSGNTSLFGMLRKGNVQYPVGLIIGPEGDLTEEEKRDLHVLGVDSVSLGGKILRSETAALFGAVLLSAFLEESHAGEHQNPWMQGEPS